MYYILFTKAIFFILYFDISHINPDECIEYDE